MPQWTVIVADMNGSEAAAGSYAAALRAAWPTDGNHCTFRAAPVADVAELADDADAVVLLSDAAPGDLRTLRLLARLEDASAAVLGLTDGPPAPDSAFAAATMPADDRHAPPEHICRTLRAMLYRQATVDRLRSELRLAQRFQGGLRGEIARMHDELQLAGLVQREFLPRDMPDLHGVRFAALWRPSNYVSGDIYDVQRLDEDHVGVFIADAVGHGMPAALMTMIICRAILMKSVQRNTYRIIPPSQVLAALNEEMLARQGERTRFATGVYVLVNCRQRRMCLAGAGHPPPLLINDRGEARELETAGGLLGVFADERYEQIDVDLNVGDRLFLYSDGFEQAFPDPDCDAAVFDPRRPTRRYRQEFAHLADLDDPQAVVARLTERLDEQRGSISQVDDLTFICMHAGALAPGRRADGAAQSDLAAAGPRA